MPGFKGQYEHSVDAKGRVAFPAKLRKSLNPAAQESFTIVQGQEKYLSIYPADEWEKVEKKLSRISQFSKKGRMVKRQYLRNAEDVSLDNQNRIALPSSLMEYAGISSKATFVGLGNLIEIWDPEALDQADQEMDQEEYQESLEELMTAKPDADGE